MSAIDFFVIGVVVLPFIPSLIVVYLICRRPKVKIVMLDWVDADYFNCRCTIIKKQNPKYTEGGEL